MLDGESLSASTSKKNDCFSFQTCPLKFFLITANPKSRMHCLRQSHSGPSSSSKSLLILTLLVSIAILFEAFCTPIASLAVCEKLYHLRNRHLPREVLRSQNLINEVPEKYPSECKPPKENEKGVWSFKAGVALKYVMNYGVCS